MKRQLSEIEALMNEKFFESRMDMIPASIKETICEIGNKKVTVSRELIIDNRVMIGVEYTPDGLIAGAYTSDKNGKRIKVEGNYKEDSTHHTPQNLISERLEEISKNMQKEKEDATRKFEKNAEERKPEAKKIKKRQISEEELHRRKIEKYRTER